MWFVDSMKLTIFLKYPVPWNAVISVVSGWRPFAILRYVPPAYAEVRELIEREQELITLCSNEGGLCVFGDNYC
jgi:hypothetical protein